MDANSVMICAAGRALASIAGSVVGMVLRRIPHRWNDILLGYCAGMMLAASIVCLLMPAIDATGVAGCWQVALGVAAGVALVGMIDYFTPHLHRLSGLDIEKHRGEDNSANRILMFVLAIAIHKFPEGVAAGIAFEGTSYHNAVAMAITIGLQNIPEGMVVVTPLMLIGVKLWRVIAISLAVAMLEVVGVYAGWLLGDVSALLLPALLGLAGGAMLYVISDEMMPETHAHGYEKPATYALIAGIFTMLMIEIS